MSTPSYRLSRRARTDIRRIYVYSETTFGRARAQSYLEALELKLQLLAERPRLGRVRPDIDERTRSFPHESHMIFYEARPSGVLVLRVLHAAQDPETNLRD